MAKEKRLFDRRAERTRSRIKKFNKTSRVRLSVFRSERHIYAQLIDDVNGLAIASASSVETDLRSKLKSGSNKEAAREVGILIANRGKAAKVDKVVFDKGGYLFHGRVKALADAAREFGLEF